MAIWGFSKVAICVLREKNCAFAGYSERRSFYLAILSLISLNKADPFPVAPFFLFSLFIK